jgi:hypothetical protein
MDKISKRIKKMQQEKINREKNEKKRRAQRIMQLLVQVRDKDPTLEIKLQLKQEVDQLNKGVD